MSAFCALEDAYDDWEWGGNNNSYHAAPAKRKLKSNDNSNNGSNDRSSDNTKKPHQQHQPHQPHQSKPDAAKAYVQHSPEFALVNRSQASFGNTDQNTSQQWEQHVKQQINMSQQQELQTWQQQFMEQQKYNNNDDGFHHTNHTNHGQMPSNNRNNSTAVCSKCAGCLNSNNNFQQTILDQTISPRPRWIPQYPDSYTPHDPFNRYWMNAPQYREEFGNGTTGYGSGYGPNYGSKKNDNETIILILLFIVVCMFIIQLVECFYTKR